MPKSVDEWFEEGVRCFKAPDGEGAVKAFNRVIDMDPAYRHTDGDNAYFYLGKIYEVEGRLEEALGLYSRALAVDPWDEESLIGRGSCATVLNRGREAIADFTRVLQIPERYRRVRPDHIMAVIAENYRKMGDHENALKWGEKALETDPRNFRMQELVGEMRRRQKTS